MYKCPLRTYLFLLLSPYIVSIYFRSAASALSHNFAGAFAPVNGMFFNLFVLWERCLIVPLLECLFECSERIRRKWRGGRNAMNLAKFTRSAG